VTFNYSSLYTEGTTSQPAMGNRCGVTAFEPHFACPVEKPSILKIDGRIHKEPPECKPFIDGRILGGNEVVTGRVEDHNFAQNLKCCQNQKIRSKIEKISTRSR